MNKNYDIFFYKLAEILDLTETQYDSIVRSYGAVAAFLCGEETLKDYKPEVFPQGSVKIGTVIKPLNEDDFDIDIVFSFNKNNKHLQPNEVKNLVGDALKKSRYLNQMQDEHGRCWTLDYSSTPPYHLDVLPALLDKDGNYHATKKMNNKYNWLPTNPKKFASWFLKTADLNNIIFDSNGVEKIKKYSHKTPLQKAVQIIKRHRDVYFRGREKEGPASVIITTLMGLAYNGEDSIKEILLNNPLKWISFINIKNGKYKISIPGLPDNFADKWNGEEPKAVNEFLKWHASLLKDIDSLFNCRKIEDFLKLCSRIFDEKTIELITNNESSIMKNLSDLFIDNKYLPMTLEETHSLYPHATSLREGGYIYIPRQNLSISIECFAYKTDYERSMHINEFASFKTNSPILHKSIFLDFRANVNGLINNYKIKWRVTNTGTEASECKRGIFEDGSTIKGRYESTAYSGSHFVQAFLIKDNFCVARSNIITINIGENYE